MDCVPTHLITAIDHVGVAVPDLDEAIALYERCFGMTLAHRETNEKQGVHEAMMAVGDPTAPHSHVQLLAPTSEESVIAKFLTKRGPGLQQVAYRVSDIDQACQAISAQGVRLLSEAPVQGTAGSRVIFLHPRDTGGVLVELVEPARS